MPQERKVCEFCAQDFAITNVYEHRRICKTRRSHGGNVVGIRTNPRTGSIIRLWQPAPQRNQFFKGWMKEAGTLFGIDNASWMLECITHRDSFSTDSQMLELFPFYKEFANYASARRAMANSESWCAECRWMNESECKVARNTGKSQLNKWAAIIVEQSRFADDDTTYLFMGERSIYSGLSEESPECQCDMDHDFEEHDSSCASRERPPFYQMLRGRKPYRKVWFNWVKTGYRLPISRAQESVELPIKVYIDGRHGAFVLISLIYETRPDSNRTYSREQYQFVYATVAPAKRGAVVDWDAAKVELMPLSRIMRFTEANRLATRRIRNAQVTSASQADITMTPDASQAANEERREAREQFERIISHEMDASIWRA